MRGEGLDQLGYSAEAQTSRKVPHLLAGQPIIAKQFSIQSAVRLIQRNPAVAEIFDNLRQTRTALQLVAVYKSIEEEVAP